jgi:diguanylate cyclase (GGDEF)-like protein
MRSATPSSWPKGSRQGDDGRQVRPYHPAVINDRAQTVPSLFDAVRALARGDDLDTTITSLCAQACAAGGAPAGVILLYDPESVQLTQAGGDPVDVAVGDDPVAGVVRERASDWDAALPAGLADVVGGAARGAIIPLVREDQAGATVEGLMILAGAPGSVLSADAPNIETVLAIADLAAVAIRQERLKSTSAEGVAYQERLARTDPLTGLADRHTFGQMLELELARATRLGTSLAVAIFDVDDLAAINEAHGSGVGDDVLRSVAATLADQVRLVDTVARIGPDEFGVIAPGDPNGTVARRVRDAVADLAPIGGVQASIRAGVAHHPQDGTSSGDLLDAAHVAITRARVEGAGTVVGLRGMPDLEASPPA